MRKEKDRRHSQGRMRMRAEKDRRAMSWVGEDRAAAPAPVQKKYEIFKRKRGKYEKEKYLTNSWHKKEKFHRC